MPSKKMMELGKAWAAQRKRKGVTKVISTLPGGQRAVDKKYLETQLFVSQDGGMAVHIVQQLAKTGAAGLISQLIAAKVNLDDPDHTGRSAVHYAASKGQGIALQELLSNGASANCQDRQGKTPLHLAVQAGNSLMVKELVLAKASLEVRDRAGRSPLLTAILCEKRSRETPGLYTQSVVTYLTAVGAVLGTADQDGRNAYHYAVLAGDTSMLHGLCEKASVPLPDEGTVSQSSSKSVAGLTSKARAAAAAAQAKAKAAAEAMNSVDAQGVSPLGLAASRGFVQAVEQLLSAKAEVNRADGRPPPGNLTPLHWAIVRCCMPACRLLIDAKADLSAVANAAAAVDSTAQENEWVSPLGLAARCGFRAMVSHLLCDQNVPFEFGMPRKVSGVDSVDVPTILQCAPAGVVAKYQAALAAHTRERETKRRPAVEKVLSEPVLFDGQKLARGKAGESFEDFAEKLEERREILRNARSAELQKAADNAQFKGQAESVEAFLERQLRTQEEIEEDQYQTWRESLPEKFKPRPMPDFAEAHKTNADALEQFVAERRRDRAEREKALEDGPGAPSFVDPASERGRRREELRAAYRARMLSTLDADTARFYREELKLTAEPESRQAGGANDNDDND